MLGFIRVDLDLWKQCCLSFRTVDMCALDVANYLIEPSEEQVTLPAPCTLRKTFIALRGDISSVFATCSPICSWQTRRSQQSFFGWLLHGSTSSLSGRSPFCQVTILSLYLLALSVVKKDKVYVFDAQFERRESSRTSAHWVRNTGDEHPKMRQKAPQWHLSLQNSMDYGTLWIWHL